MGSNLNLNSTLTSTTLEVRRLLAHPAFDIRNPNKVHALIRSFNGNHLRFHAADGGGYANLADQMIAIGAFNPQVAARMARAFDRWKKFDSGAGSTRVPRSSASATPREFRKTWPRL